MKILKRTIDEVFRVPRMEMLAAIDYGKIVQNKIWTFEHEYGTIAIAVSGFLGALR